MRAALLSLVILSLSGARLLAQQVAVDVSRAASNAPLSRLETAKVGKNLQANGPLAEPLKTPTTQALGKRLLRWVTPALRPTEPKPERVLAPISAEAWATAVGWNAGKSAFPDGETHESTMSLISFTSAPK